MCILLSRLSRSKLLILTLHQKKKSIVPNEPSQMRMTEHDHLDAW
jgi:hypothetical protein